MTISIRRIAASALVATTLATGAFVAATPAQAGGQVSLNIVPADAEQAQLMQLGLGVYALVNGVQNGSISQNGFGNAAGLAQYGSGNFGVVHQEGNGHNGTLTQNGNGNSYGLFQFGSGTNAHVNQNGGGTGLGFVWGWE